MSSFFICFAKQSGCRKQMGILPVLVPSPEIILTNGNFTNIFRTGWKSAYCDQIGSALLLQTVFCTMIASKSDSSQRMSLVAYSVIIMMYMYVYLDNHQCALGVSGCNQTLHQHQWKHTCSCYIGYQIYITCLGVH